jgi:hypothetical protein
MPRLFTPIRSKRSTEVRISRPLQTPIDAPGSPSNLTPELVCSPSIFVKTECSAGNLPDTVAERTAQPDSAVGVPMGRVPDTDSNGATAWPSELYKRSSTMWLLPPHSNQSSAIVNLLQTEIQSHNITRDMLHTTEQRRLEAVQKNNQLTTDTQSWAAAYNNLTVALGKCAEEYSRVSADNVNLREQLQAHGVSHNLLLQLCSNVGQTFSPDRRAPENHDIRILHGNSSEEWLSNRRAIVQGTGYQDMSYDSDGSECHGSPEV